MKIRNTNLKSINSIKSIAPLKSALVLAAGLALSVPTAQAEVVKRSFCVWDPIGANGPLFNIMKTTKTVALKWGVDLDLRAYTDEKVVAEDFKAQQCDSVLITGTKAREFNKFTGSLDALGALPSDEEMRIMLETLTSPKAAKLLKSGKYEVAGILPAGSVYLYTRDRSVDTVNELQGKKIGTLEYDKAAVHMVRHVGASVVGTTTANFAGKFNNGSVDLVYAPAAAYTPLELYKGIGENGGVFSYKLAQFSFQTIIHSDRFPDDYGQKMREFSATRYDEAYEIIEQAESEIAQEFWTHPTAEDAEKYAAMFRSVRIGLRDDGVYDAKALKLMRKVRCKKNPSHAECAEKTE